MTQNELDSAAHRLIYAKDKNNPSVPIVTTTASSTDTRLPYFDHLGGYELRDYTCRSERGRRNGRDIDYEDDESDDDDDEVSSRHSCLHGHHHDDSDSESGTLEPDERGVLYVTTL